MAKLNLINEAHTDMISEQKNYNYEQIIQIKLLKLI